MSTRLDFERTYPHPQHTVWRVLSEPELLARWLMPVEDFVPEEGCAFRFVTEPAPGFDGIVHCRILTVEPPQLLRFSWRGGPIDTVVTFRLEAVAAGTKLRFEQTGFKGFKAWITRAILKAGFKKMYAELLPDLLTKLAQPHAGGSASEEPETEGSSGEPAACGGPLHRARLFLLHPFKRK